MASTKEIKNRIKSVKSTKKITKAMELVAASKMKRAITQTMASRLYATYSWELLTSLSQRLEEITNRFLTENDNTKCLAVLITSNRGLCGGYNSQAIKKIINLLREDGKGLTNTKTVRNIDIVTVGKKGDGAMRRIGQNVVATFTDMPDNLKLDDTRALSKFLLDEFKSDKYGKIYIIYTDFISALTQTPKIRKILPVSKEEIKEIIESQEKGPGQKANPYIFEGDMDNILSSLIEKLIQMQIYQMILESNASEQSARMIAMKNATEAAEEMVDDLTLVFNKARQAGITREISEISAGMASVS